MGYAAMLNGSDASRAAFAARDITLTQDEADHVFPIMEAYEGIIDRVRSQIDEQQPPQPGAVWGS